MAINKKAAEETTDDELFDDIRTAGELINTAKESGSDQDDAVAHIATGNLTRKYGSK